MATGKKIVAPYVLENATALVASHTTNPFSIQYLDRATVEILCIGTLTGTVTVQGSVDYVPPSQTLLIQVANPTWVDIPLGLNALTGIDQGFIVDFTETGMPWIRVNLTVTGGAGALTVVLTGKES